jgi:hypothetical protein
LMVGGVSSSGASCPGAMAEWSLAALAVETAMSSTTAANGQRRRPIRPLSVVGDRSLVASPGFPRMRESKRHSHWRIGLGELHF